MDGCLKANHNLRRTRRLGSMKLLASTSLNVQSGNKGHPDGTHSGGDNPLQPLATVEHSLLSWWLFLQDRRTLFSDDTLMLWFVTDSLSLVLMLTKGDWTLFMTKKSVTSTVERISQPFGKNITTFVCHSLPTNTQCTFLKMASLLL